MTKTRTPELAPARSVSRLPRASRGHSSLATRHFLFVLLTGALLVWCPCAFALNPALDVSQYAHTAWKVREGFAKGEIYAITQTPDGYLWLSTEFGLVRFDGVRAVPWQPPAGEQLPSNHVTKLVVTRDGTLWIGTLKGLASWKDGKLTQYPELDGQLVLSLLEGREGTVWVGGGFPGPGRLCGIHGGTVQCHGEDGTLGPAVFGLYEDRNGNLWAGVQDGLWRWKPGPPKFYSLPGEPDGIQGLAEDADGALLISLRGGVRRFVDGKAVMAYPYPGPDRQLQALRLLRGSRGTLWIGTFARGLVHVHQGKTDVFLPADGLSGENVLALFEDREGNIWVATNEGLDRFRDSAVTTFSVKQGLSSAFVGSVLADNDGTVWVTTKGGLNRWKDSKISIFGGRDGKLNRDAPNSLFQDSRGRIWVSTNREFGYMENNRFIPLRGIPGGPVHGMAEDTLGNLWIANQSDGLFQLLPGNVVQQIPWAKFGQKDYGWSLAADPLQGGLWIGFVGGGIVYFRDGQVRASYSAAEGSGDHFVNDFRFDPDGAVWAAAESGLSRLKNGRVATLTSKNGLPCDAVHWAIRDTDQSFWLNMPCGLVRIVRSEIDAWAAAVDKDKDVKRAVQATLFDSSDGVRSRSFPGGYTPQVTRSSDGKLWFAGLDGVSVVDPYHLPFNRLAPPVHVEQITADRKSYDATSAVGGRLPLPALIRDLQIEYTALSLAVPEKVRFRYKLEGLDRDWHDAGNRRQAFYTNLPPRNYRFRVMACNNSGVWNEESAFLDFSVAPAYYQIWWFRLACVATFLVLLWALYQYRLHQIERQFSIGFEARSGERLRIARELHDTLLQSLQGLLLRFQTASNLLPARPEEAKQKLDHAIDMAAEAVTEGRSAVQGLRSSATVTDELAVAISALAKELAGNETSQNSPVFRVDVEGEPRDLHPILRDEVYRIAAEASRNAFCHAHAEHIEVEIRYDASELRLRIRDDGTGIEREVIEDDGRTGHWGLHGMRERAKIIGGNLEVWSSAQSGTEVELTIPARVAYASAGQRRSWFSRKGPALKS